MTEVAVVFHAGEGRLQRLAESVAEGAGARLVPIDGQGRLPSDGWDALRRATTIVFGASSDSTEPTCPFRTFAAALAQSSLLHGGERKLFAGFTDRVRTLGERLPMQEYFFDLATRLGGIWLGTEMAPSDPSCAERGRSGWIGSLGTALSESLANHPLVPPFPASLEAGRQFGRQVAEAATRLEEWVRSSGLGRLTRGRGWS